MSRKLNRFNNVPDPDIDQEPKLDDLNATDQDLISAFTKGDFISIGTIKQQSTKLKSEASPTEFEIPYFLYNNPIGIDFSKAISPILFLSSGFLINRLSEIPLISQELRYILENLKNQLYNGKIAEFIQTLGEIIGKKMQKGIQFQPKMDSAMVQAFINILAFILNNESVLSKNSKNTTGPEKSDNIVQPNWIKPQQLMDYLDHPEEMKTKIKEFRTICELTANRFSLSFYLRILLDQVISHLPSDEKPDFWLILRQNLNKEDLTAVSTNLESRVSHRITFTEEKPINNIKTKEKTQKINPSTINDPVFWDLILILSYAFNIK